MAKEWRPALCRCGFATARAPCQTGPNAQNVEAFLRVQLDGRSSGGALVTGEVVKRSYVVGQTEIAARPLEPALYLVATPIGNLGDITLRALETLAAADIVACEDTRVSRVLLDRYGIRRRTTAYHEHNAGDAGPKLIAALAAGQSVALISDAGTPLISDPGYRLVGEAIDHGIRVVPIPGASAALAALTASGLPSDAFLFAGFLPVKSGQRLTRLAELRGVPATLIFFESPRRLAETLGAMTEALGGARKAAIGRELTKTFEEMRTGTGRPLCGSRYAQGRSRHLRRPARSDDGTAGRHRSTAVVARHRAAGVQGGGGSRENDRRPEAGALPSSA
jgi:16S rRNA (cytidine1402-2'-O)-methyltransferase